MATFAAAKAEANRIMSSYPVVAFVYKNGAEYDVRVKDSRQQGEILLDDNPPPAGWNPGKWVDMDVTTQTGFFWP